jgi:hypothetical protein
MQALEPVRVRDCACPGEPHPEGDIVYLAAKLPFQGGLIANQQAIAQAEAVRKGDTNQLQNLWLETFVRFGARDWNFLDAEGNPIPFDVEELLADYSLALPVAEKANDLGYGDAAMAPFLRQPAKPSANGRTPVTTSARRSRTRSSAE